MDFQQIKELILLVNSTGITELELEEGDLRIRIRKSGQAAGPIPQAEPGVGSSRLEDIAAPMVGTLHNRGHEGVERNRGRSQRRSEEDLGCRR
jgi:biotin carboxyl carrier protein